MKIYRIIEVLGEGLIAVESEYGRQLFTPRKLRKPKRCATCGADIAKGEKAWGEVTSCSQNRSDRVHGSCIRKPLAHE